MRDVRVVLYGFLLVALVSAVFVVLRSLRRPRDAARWSGRGARRDLADRGNDRHRPLRVLRVRHGLPALPRDLLPGRQLLRSPTTAT